jgi:hypothetical protein
MTQPHDIRNDLGPDASDDLIALAQRLELACPLPDPGFRGRLRRHLVARSERVRTPTRVRRLITGYATAGSVLLVVGAAGAAGAGPLG